MQLKTIVLQNMAAAISIEQAASVPINERFQSEHHLLDVTHENVFAESPSALFEAFLIMEQESGTHRHDGARTIRTLWRSKKTDR